MQSAFKRILNYMHTTNRKIFIAVFRLGDPLIFRHHDMSSLRCHYDRNSRFLDGRDQNHYDNLDFSNISENQNEPKGTTFTSHVSMRSYESKTKFTEFTMISMISLRCHYDGNSRFLEGNSKITTITMVIWTSQISLRVEMNQRVLPLHLTNL